MSIFAGAMLINASPKPLKPITGSLVGATCWYLRKKAMKGCLPFVKERLENTAKFKADSSFDWTPPVSLQMFRYIAVQQLTAEYRKMAFSGLLMNVTLQPPKVKSDSLIPSVLLIVCF